MENNYIYIDIHLIICHLILDVTTVYFTRNQLDYKIMVLLECMHVSLSGQKTILT